MNLHELAAKGAKEYGRTQDNNPMDHNYATKTAMLQII